MPIDSLEFHFFDESIERNFSRNERKYTTRAEKLSETEIRELRVRYLRWCSNKQHPY